MRAELVAQPPRQVVRRSGGLCPDRDHLLGSGPTASPERAAARRRAQLPACACDPSRRITSGIKCQPQWFGPHAVAADHDRDRIVGRRLDEGADGPIERGVDFAAEARTRFGPPAPSPRHRPATNNARPDAARQNRSPRDPSSPRRAARRRCPSCRRRCGSTALQIVPIGPTQAQPLGLHAQRIVAKADFSSASSPGGCAARGP